MAKLGWGTSRLLAVCLGVVGLPACETTAPPSGATATTQATTAVPRTTFEPPVAPRLVFASDPKLFGEPSQTTVKPATQHNLWIRAELPNVDGITGLTLTFINPKGEAFYQRSFPFSMNAARTTHGAMGHEIPLFHPATIPGGFALDVMVPLFGSPFERQGIPGAWRLDAQVEHSSGATTSLSYDFDLDLNQ